jgi:hypothetical protein
MSRNRIISSVSITDASPVQLGRGQSKRHNKGSPAGLPRIHESTDGVQLGSSSWPCNAGTRRFGSALFPPLYDDHTKALVLTLFNDHLDSVFKLIKQRIID